MIRIVVGWLVLLAMVGVISAIARSKRPMVFFAQISALAVVLRIVGGVLRYLIIRYYYRGLGDAMRYYEDGIEHSAELRRFDFSDIYAALDAGNLWGTRFIEWVSGVAITLIGENLIGEFIFFSLIGLIGSICFTMAFYRSGTTRSKQVLKDYVILMCLFPSLWFWPSSVGKEAVMLCGLGIAVLGYMGRGGRIAWIPFGIGLALTFAVRPHVATVFIASVGFAEWFGRKRAWTLGRIVQAIVALVVFIFVLKGATARFGFDATDLQGAQEFLDWSAGQTQQGGSNIGPSGGGFGGILLGFVNILFRPFLFEAHNIMALFSALEMTALWVLVWKRRKKVRRALKRWRADRFLRFGLPMTFFYTLMLGMTFSNLGIIARQRVLVMPFLFAIVVGREALVRKKRPSQVPPLAPVKGAA